jgi:hypothetical protein
MLACEGSALNVVVFLMLVGSVAADTKATKEMLTHSTTTQSRLRTVIRQYQVMRVALAVAVAPTSDHRPFYSRAPFR